MTLLEAALKVAILICLSTPVWYIPVRRCVEHFGYPRTISGRVRRATLSDWLNATGCGVAAGTLLTVWLQWLRGRLGE